MDILHTDHYAVFAAGSSTSSVIDLRNYELVGIRTDANLVTTTLTFKDASAENDTPDNVLDYSGAAVNLTGVLASQKYLLNSDNTEALEYVTLTSSAPQTAGTAIRLITKQRA